jgi:hypothetical protein
LTFSERFKSKKKRGEDNICCEVLEGKDLERNDLNVKKKIELLGNLISLILKTNFMESLIPKDRSRCGIFKKRSILDQRF